jgi:hypothetical protein
LRVAVVVDHVGDGSCVENPVVAHMPNRPQAPCLDDGPPSSKAALEEVNRARAALRTVGGLVKGRGGGLAKRRAPTPLDRKPSRRTLNHYKKGSTAGKTE